MSDYLAQCCYTNTEEYGWHTVAVSNNCHADAQADCRNLQVALSGNRKTTDENGNPIKNYDVCSIGSHTFVISTQYGLKDKFSRDNMFSHAYICLSEDFISNPNVLLSIKEDCFKTNEDDAIDSYLKIKYDNPFDFSSAFTYCGLNEESYNTIIQCVFEKITGNIPEPLYIDVGDDKKIMMALLYCIYMGLPKNLRRKLSVSSNEISTSNDRHIIFAKPSLQYSNFLNYQTGENSILTERSIRRNSNNRFSTYFSENPLSLDRKDYFDELEDKAQALSPKRSQSPEILLAAHYCITNEEITDMSFLQKHLFKLLSKNDESNDDFDNYVALCIETLTKNNQILDKDIVLVLDKKIEQEQANDSLLTAYKNNKISKFLSLSEEEAIECLNREKPPFLQELISVLKKQSDRQRNNRILDSHYCFIFANHLFNNWDELSCVINKVQPIEDYPKLKKELSHKAIVLYENEIKKGYPLNQVFNGYDNFLSSIHSEEKKQLSLRAYSYFWDTLSFDEVSFDEKDRKLYSLYSIENNENCKFFYTYCNLPELYWNNSAQFFKQGPLLFIENKLSLLDEEKNSGKRKLYQKIVNTLADNKQIALFRRWFEIFYSISNSEFLIKSVLIYQSLLSNANEKEIMDVFQNIVHFSYDDERSKRIVRSFAKIIVDYFIKLERNGECISLKSWVTLSKTVYDNAFELFNHFGVFDPKVLSFAECPDCELLKHYKEDIKAISSSEYSKVFRSWLKKTRSPLFGKKSDERNQRDQIEYSIFEDSNETTSEDTGKNSGFNNLGSLGSYIDEIDSNSKNKEGRLKKSFGLFKRNK